MKKSAKAEINNGFRDSGLKIVGKLPWGTHFCQFYQTQKDLSDILVRYFKAGLENNEFCVWVTSEFLTDKEAIVAMKKAIPDFTKYLKKGQMEIFPYTDWYLKSGKFEMSRVLKKWVAKHDEGIAKGFDGMRVSGNPFWIDNKKDWDDFAAYEAQINHVIGPYKLLVLCTYFLNKCGANEIIDVVTNHQFALIKRSGAWEIIESTEQKKTKEALRKSEERFKDTLDNLMEGCQIISPDWRYLYVNNAVVKQAYTTKEALLGKTMMDSFPGIEKTEVFSKLKSSMIKRVSLVTETEFVFPNREKSWFQLSIHPIPEGIFILSVDITERKRVDKEIAHLASFPRLNINPIAEMDMQGNVTYANPAMTRLFPDIRKKKRQHPLFLGIEPESMKKMVKPLIREVSQGERWYRESIHYLPEIGSIRVYCVDITERKKLEQQKDHFLGVATHELKTPVTSIKAYAQVLHQVFYDRGDSKSAEMLGKMEGQVNRLINLIKELLDITKMQTGKLQFNEDYFDFNEMVREVVEEVQRISPAHEMTKELVQTRVVYGDRERIGQVLTNFLTNAIKYSPPKNEVKIMTKAKNGEIILSVQDFGIGIPKAKLQKIFKRFYQIEAPGERTPTGLGLGLYISSEIIKRHEGRIWVESEMGKGSIFSFSLCLSKGEAK